MTLVFMEISIPFTFFQLDGFPISTLDVVSLQLGEVGGVPGVWLPADCTDLNCHILVITKLTRK